MPRIPVYEQRLAPNNLGPQPRASGAPLIDTSRGYRDLAAGIAQAGQAIGGALNQEAEDDANAQVSKALSDGRLYWNDELDKRAGDWKETGPSLRESFDADFKKWKEEQLATAGTPKAKRYLEARLDDMRTTYATAAANVDQKKRLDLRAARDDQTLFNRVQTVSKAPGQVDVVLGEALAEIEARGDMDPAAKIKRGHAVKMNIYSAAENAEMNRDPSAWLMQRVGKPKAGEAAAAPVAATGATALAAAIYGQESGSGKADTSKPNYAGALGPMQITEDTWDRFQSNGVIPKGYQWGNPEQNKEAGERIVEHYFKKYDGDAAKVAAAYYGGEGAINADGSINRHWRDKKNPKAPTVGEYIDQVLSRAGAATASATASGSAGYIELDTAPKTFLGLHPTDRERLVREAQRMAVHKDAVATQSLSVRLQDVMAMAKDGVTDPQPMTREQFSVLGDKADATWAEYQRSQVLATDMKSLSGSTNQELMAWASGAQKRAVPGAGYAAEDQFDSFRSQAAAAILKKRADDPVGYVIGTVPDVNAAARAAAEAEPDQRAEATKRLVTQTLAAQKALGIANPRILSDSQVADLSGRIMGAKRPEDASDLVSALEAEYSPQHFPQVMRELAFKGELTPALMIIPDLKKPAARELVSRLAVTSRRDLDALIDKDAKRDIETKAVEHAMRLRETMGPLGKVGNAQIAAYREMIERIAIDSMASGGHKNAKDATQAAFDMLLGHYQFEDSLRMPADVDAGRVRYGLKNRIGALGLTAADVPASEVAGYKPDEALAQWNNTVAARSFWLADDDTKRAMLWARGANGVTYPVLKGGQQIGYSFEELSIEHRPYENTVKPSRTNMREYEREQARLKAERMKAEREQYRAK